jgi:hypothetical protein
MDRDKVKVIIRNMELLLDSLKAEIYTDVPSYSYDDIKPYEEDYDEIYDEK